MAPRRLCFFIIQRHAQAAETLDTKVISRATVDLQPAFVVDHGDVLHHCAQALEALGNHTDAFLDLQRLRAAAPSYPGIAELLRLAAGRALQQQKQARPCQVRLQLQASAAPLSVAATCMHPLSYFRGVHVPRYSQSGCVQMIRTSDLRLIYGSK